MTGEEITDLRGGSVADIVEQLDDLTADDLREMLTQERADNRPRSTLIDAIEDRLSDQAEAAAEQDKGGKVARGEEITPDLPAWKQPDYTGPLSGDQALWRNANIRKK